MKNDNRTIHFLNTRLVSQEFKGKSFIENYPFSKYIELLKSALKNSNIGKLSNDLESLELIDIKSDSQGTTLLINQTRFNTIDPSSKQRNSDERDSLGVNSDIGLEHSCHLYFKHEVNDECNILEAVVEYIPGFTLRKIQKFLNYCLTRACKNASNQLQFKHIHPQKKKDGCPKSCFFYPQFEIEHVIADDIEELFNSNLVTKFEVIEYSNNLPTIGEENFCFETQKSRIYELNTNCSSIKPFNSFKKFIKNLNPINNSAKPSKVRLSCVDSNGDKRNPSFDIDEFDLLGRRALYKKDSYDIAPGQKTAQTEINIRVDKLMKKLLKDGAVIDSNLKKSA